MADMPITAPKLLLVEGVDDRHFFQRIQHSLDIGEDELQVVEYGGKDQFPKFIKELPKIVSGFFEIVQSFGVVRDADDSAENAFKSVRDALARVGFPTPTGPGVFVAGAPRVGILIVPGSNSSGMLEDLCLAAVKGDTAMSCVDEYIHCLERAGLPVGNRAKVGLYAFLSSRRKPGLQLGTAIDAHYIPLDSPAFSNVRHFLRSI